MRSGVSLEDWQKHGFASYRAEEFDALVAEVHAEGVPREMAGKLSVQEFWEKYELKRTPCVIAGIPETESWPAAKNWVWPNFFERFARSEFEFGVGDDGFAMTLRLEHFQQYMRTQTDDNPFYVFDNWFVDDKEQLLKDYSVPSYFPDDYMGLASEHRTPYRWVLIGPRRSGSVMHQDPLCTNAWNTSISGRKLWLMFPPDTPPEIAKGTDVMKPGDDEEADAINHFLDLLPRQRARKDSSFQPILFLQHPGASPSWRSGSANCPWARRAR